MKNDSDYYIKQIRLRNIIIVTLLAGIAIIIYLWQFYSTLKIDFAEPVEFGIANDQVTAFRGATTLDDKGEGVWYHKSDMDYYLETIYPQIVEAQKEYQEEHEIDVEARFEWKPVMYYMFKIVGGVSMIDFCVIPTLVDPNSEEVLDFFSNPDYYTKIADLSYKTGKGNKRGPTSVIFNTGHLFP